MSSCLPTKEGFTASLKAAHAPYYAYPRFEPEEGLRYYALSTIRSDYTVMGGRKEFSQQLTFSHLTQEKIYRALTDLAEIKPYVIGISSYPSEQHACELAGAIMLSLVRKHDLFPGDWFWLTPSVNLKKFQSQDEPGFFPKVVVIRKLNVKDTTQRYKVRNLLEAYARSLRFVLIPGIDPVDYFCNHIKFSASGFINIFCMKRSPHPLVIPKEENYALEEIQYAEGRKRIEDALGKVYDQIQAERNSKH